MKSRLVFKVEKKIGSMPDISFKCVFERDVSLGDGSSCIVAPSVEEVINVLLYLYPEHRVSVICDLVCC